jgi:hypothetical protein
MHEVDETTEQMPAWNWCARSWPAPSDGDSEWYFMERSSSASWSATVEPSRRR